MPSLIGLIMLMGIATKNSILLVEYAIMARRDRGMTRMEALLDACHKRARPIIMTTHRDGRRHDADRARPRRRPELPLADGDRRDRRPDHLDFLSLLVIPVVFTFVDDAVQKLKRVFGKRHAPTAAQEPAAT